MEHGNIDLMNQQDAGEIKKNKGGRPKGSRDNCKYKVTLYLTQEELELLPNLPKRHGGPLIIPERAGI